MYNIKIEGQTAVIYLPVDATPQDWANAAIYAFSLIKYRKVEIVYDLA